MLVIFPGKHQTPGEPGIKIGMGGGSRCKIWIWAKDLLHLSMQAEETTTFHQSLLAYGVHTGPEGNRMFSKL